MTLDRYNGLDGLGRRESLSFEGPTPPWTKKGMTEQQYLKEIAPTLSRALLDISNNNPESLIENHKEVITQLSKVVELAGFLHTKKETDKIKALFALISREVKNEQHSIHGELDEERVGSISKDSSE